MKRLLSILLVLTLCLVSTPCNVSAKPKSKAITVKNYEENTLDNVTYKMPKGWEEITDSGFMYYYNDSNFAMVQTYDCEYGFDNQGMLDGFIDGLTGGEGVTLVSKKAKEFQDGITALTLEFKMKKSDKTFYIKSFSFVYEETLYSFSIVSDLQKNTKILDKLTEKIVLE